MRRRVRLSRLPRHRTFSLDLSPPLQLTTPVTLPLPAHPQPQLSDHNRLAPLASILSSASASHSSPSSVSFSTTASSRKRSLSPRRPGSPPLALSPPPEAPSSVASPDPAPARLSSNQLPAQPRHPVRSAHRPILVPVRPAIVSARGRRRQCHGGGGGGCHVQGGAPLCLAEGGGADARDARRQGTGAGRAVD